MWATKLVEEIQPIVEEVKEPTSFPEVDVNQDGKIDNDDLRKINEFLADPNLPKHKREYWEALKTQLLEKLDEQNNTKVY